MKYLSQITNEVVLCKEMTVANYRELLKTTFGEDVNKEFFVENFFGILSEITNKDTNYLKGLSLFDVIYLLFDIYSNSIGICKITVTHENQTMNVELDLSELKQFLFSYNQYFSHTIDAGSFKILLKPPSVERTLQPAKYNFLNYIKGVEADSYIEIKTNQQAAALIETLPPQVVNTIATKYKDINNLLSKINFLSLYNLHEIQFNFFPTFEVFLWIVKLLFGDSLSQFYENFFYLSYSGKFNAEFIEKISVGEFNYFIGLLKHVLTPESEADSTGSPIQHSVGLNEI